MKTIHVLRKPLCESTVAANVLRWGTGALNIDATRVAFTDNVNMEAQHRQHTTGGVIPSAFGAAGLIGKAIPTYKPGGRWPANLILQHLDGCEQEGAKKVKGHKGYPNGPKGKSTHYSSEARSVEVRPNPWIGHADPDGTETIAAWRCVPECPVAGLDSQSGECPSTMAGRLPSSAIVLNPGSTKNRGVGWGNIGLGTSYVYSDTGGASRFFKQVKP